LIDHALRLNPTLSFKTVRDFIRIPLEETKKILNLLQAGSELVALIKAPLLSGPETLKFLSRLAESPISFQVLSEALKPESHSIRSISAPLFLPLRAWIKPGLEQVTLNPRSAFASYFKEYCPSLNPNDDACKIDPDQVKIFKASPDQLFRSIIQEYLASDQSWLDPAEGGLTHELRVPDRASHFEFHLNPALHLLQDSPNSLQAAFNAVNRIQEGPVSIKDFIETRGQRLTMIPYHFQFGDDPAAHSRSFKDTIRLRMVSDLDRLELIAINADFKAFGIAPNFGLKMIRDIALAWGDVPPGNRPLTLSRLINPNEVRTLAEVKQSIEALLSTLDHLPLDTLAVGDELHDLRARVFNLHPLITLLKQELPVENGGKGGMTLIRDLFFSLYEMNTRTQKDSFWDGLRINSVCLPPPYSLTGPHPECKKDLLTLIPRIAYLGLLHNTGLAFIKQNQTVIESTVLILTQAAKDPLILQKLKDTLPRRAGVATLSDAIHLLGKLPGASIGKMSSAVRLVSKSENLNWAYLAIELARAHPSLIRKNEALIRAALETLSSSPPGPISRTMSDGITFFSSGLTPELRAEWTTRFGQIESQSDSIARSIQNLSLTPAPRSQNLRDDWASALAFMGLPAQTSVRAGLSNWVRGPDFISVLDLYSDSDWSKSLGSVIQSLNRSHEFDVFLSRAQSFLNGNP
jgi:hypothetical protein